MEPTELAKVGGKPHDQRDNSGVTFAMKDANNKMLAEALDKLDGFTGWHGKTIYAFNRIKTSYDEHQEAFRKAFRKLVRKHAVHIKERRPSEADPKVMVDVIDEKTGKPKMTAKMVSVGGGMRDFVWKDKAAFNKDFAALGTETWTIKAYKLTTDELLAGGLEPRELRACIMITEDADPEILQSYQRSLEPDLDDEEEDAEEDEAEEPAPPPEPAYNGPEHSPAS